MTSLVINETDFSGYDEPEKSHCLALQRRAMQLLRQREWRNYDELLNFAAATLIDGKETPLTHTAEWGKYAEIYVCEQCHQMYHADYANSTVWQHDYCSAECACMHKDGEY